jgi:hypothetical protein
MHNGAHLARRLELEIPRWPSALHRLADDDRARIERGLQNRIDSVAGEIAKERQHLVALIEIRLGVEGP